MKKIIFMLLAVAALTSCSKFEPVNGDETGSPVELSGVINSGEATRVGGVITAIPSPSLSLDVYRADETSTSYGTTYTLQYPGVLRQSDSKIATTTALYYLPNATLKSSFIALSPAGGTHDFPTTNTVTYPLDGYTDILGTKAKEGNKGGPALSLTFDHLLTKIQVKVKAKNDANNDPAGISGVVGQITDIKVVATDAVTVTLPAPGNISDLPVATASGNVAELTLRNADGTDADAVTLPTNGDPTLYGVAMFAAPTTGSQTLTLKVTFAGNDGANPFTLNSAAAVTLKPGHEYDIVVAFTADAGSIIESVGEIAGGLNSWNNAEIDDPDEEEIE